MSNRVYEVTATFIVSADDEIEAKNNFWNQAENGYLMPVTEQPKVVLRSHIEGGFDIPCKGDICELCEADNKKTEEPDNE